jgi:hypothetical protein
VEQTGLRPRPALQVLLTRVQVGLRHLRRDLVEGGEHVVRRDHDRLRRGLGVTAPRAQDLVPRDTCRDAVRVEDRFDGLAAARLEDAELGHAAQLLAGRGAGLARGGEEEVEAGLAGAGDRRSLRGHSGGVVPPDQAHDRPSHVAADAGPAALELRDQRGGELGS